MFRSLTQTRMAPAVLCLAALAGMPGTKRRPQQRRKRASGRRPKQVPAA